MSLGEAPRVVTHVGIGACAVGQGDSILEANLGSCLGIAIAWPGKRLYALAHVLLPTHSGDPKDRRFSRYADTAPRFLLRRLRVPADQLRSLRGIVGGGAHMYNQGSTRLHVGADNIASGRQALRDAGVRVLGHDTGGDTPRRIRIDCRTGIISVVRMGSAADDPDTTREWTP